jgi:Ankyrin repeats (3 copies)
MSSPLIKKRMHESTTSLFDAGSRKIMKRTISVPQVVPNEFSEQDMVAKALMQLRTSIDSNEHMAQWFKRCDEQVLENPACSSDSSTSSSCSSRDDELNDSEHSASPISSINTQREVPKHLAQMLRSKIVKKPSNPDEFLQALLSLKGRPVQFQSAASLSAKGFFPKITEDFTRGYSMELVAAVRNDDVATLRRIHEENPTRSLLCGSKFGDSIIHLACRRNCVKVLEFLLCEMDLSPQLVCDYGRTPLHDALWNTKLNERILTLLLNKCPALLFVTDHRGSTPLSYTPRDQWTYICRFLAQHIKKNGTFLSDSNKNTDAVHVVPLDNAQHTLLEQ